MVVVEEESRGGGGGQYDLVVQGKEFGLNSGVVQCSCITVLKDVSTLSRASVGEDELLRDFCRTHRKLETSINGARYERSEGGRRT